MGFAVLQYVLKGLSLLTLTQVSNFATTHSYSISVGLTVFTMATVSVLLFLSLIFIDYKYLIIAIRGEKGKAENLKYTSCMCEIAVGQISVAFFALSVLPCAEKLA